MKLRPVILFGLLIFLASCNKESKPFEVSEFSLLSNFHAESDSTVKLSLDLDNAVLNGIEIPTSAQCANGYFNFSFRVKNNSSTFQKFFFKLYYQNETYKFNEDHPFCNENFYGSWQNTNATFKPTVSLAPGQEVLVSDSFKITGNPRNEKKYYGTDMATHQINQATIDNTIQYIKSNPDWVKQIKEKASTNKVSENDQLYIDALWSLNAQKERDSSENNRWKRNPRTGLYEFMLVVCGQEDLKRYPETFKDISSKGSDGNFLNPFAYVKNNKINSLHNSEILHGTRKLHVNAKLNLSKGIYVNPLSVDKPGFTREYYSDLCSDSADLYKSAHMELFYHNINRDYVLHNVKLHKDVVGENLTREEYKKLVSDFKGEQLIDTYVNSTDCPCRNVSVNTAEGSLTLRNPGNKEGEYKKEHVGVISRVGFTYGCFRAKIKFPETLSKDHVWNGITNAFWLMAQDVNAGWNMRRTCDANIAYIPKQEPDNEESMMRSHKQITYSEIDFEILKESEFWPKSSYQISNVPYLTDDCANNHDIMVTCTNWDMACHEPEFYNIGAVEHAIDGVKFIHHRWNQWYKALTTKVKAAHDDLFKAPYYYYEVQWWPEKIIWRIGPEKDKMRTICIMDKNVSSIPNNQMLMIITQEWHNQEWWPTAPYKQNFIPFPKNDIIGKVLELEIE